ncbi:YcaQ family DNA glycosylase [filamentous cyanobacterium LEGE 11480]|uniref:YcaQ family DNA glycosylase n=1 Tax=Romeriopsis navalis LEGE 11480 TaxID=2777977 RepID=A0A928VGU2_9CYAN|nr:crosslink repair DNA glycosylase YcaQ family protein [Romeriopsis navalis]MBE9028356.1 YcaQ family DNA glycosylase [Romeriopsis navalis LEGE 11480]
MLTVDLNSRDLRKLRRIALQKQGLTSNSPFGRGLAGTETAIAHLGYVQVDTISVVARAHHHVLHSRVANYQPAMLDQLLKNRRVFEYWSHAAAFLPIAAYRYSLPYKHAIKSGKRHWFKNPDYKLMDQLMERVRAEGPLRSRDIESGKTKAGGWWEWKPAKRALEQLYFQGDLMVCERQGFQKAYDLPERVLPADIDTTVPTFSEYAAYLLDQQLACHGFVSLKGITYQRRDDQLRKATKQLVEERLADGRLIWLKSEACGSYLAPPDLLDRSLPRIAPQARILSPFDNCVIQRDRLMDLFGFDYQIECYVPQAKRKFGYFCLPLLFQDQFIGRLDCKAHRKQAWLEVKSLYFEATNLDLDRVLPALVTCLRAFAAFQDVDRISITQVFPNKLTQTVRHHFEP